MVGESLILHPVVVGVAAVLSSMFVAYLGYRQSQKSDEIAKQAGLATVESGTIKQLIDGQNELIQRLQEETKRYREVIIAIDTRLATVIGECRLLERELSELKQRFGVKA